MSLNHVLNSCSIKGESRKTLGREKRFKNLEERPKSIEGVGKPAGEEAGS